LEVGVTRKAISKKTRFEIFKRDSFTCQYCGAHPPSVVLEVDHINPVSNGGDNLEGNLITACFGCNRGKSDRSLMDAPQSLQDKAAQVLEREAQIKGYQKAMDLRQARLDSEAIDVCEVYERFNDGYTLNEKAIVSVCLFISKLGVHDVIEAMEIAHSKTNLRQNQEFRYFCGICWSKIKELAL
jgi:HNH endonuclease